MKITPKQASMLATLKTTRDMKSADRAEVEMCRRLEAKGLVFGVGLRFVIRLTAAGVQALANYAKDIKR